MLAHESKVAKMVEVAVRDDNAADVCERNLLAMVGLQFGERCDKVVIRIRPSGSGIY